MYIIILLFYAEGRLAAAAAARRVHQCQRFHHTLFWCIDIVMMWFRNTRRFPTNVPIVKRSRRLRKKIKWFRKKSVWPINHNTRSCRCVYKRRILITILYYRRGISNIFMMNTLIRYMDVAYEHTFTTKSSPHSSCICHRLGISTAHIIRTYNSILWVPNHFLNIKNHAN